MLMNNPHIDAFVDSVQFERNNSDLMKAKFHIFFITQNVCLISKFFK